VWEVWEVSFLGIPAFGDGVVDVPRHLVINEPGDKTEFNYLEC